MENKKRIKTLDLFRFISITLVVFFHYLSRWTPPFHTESYYPYGSRFNELEIIKNGGVGVLFFFMISGFVILFTLERTSSIRLFFTNRLIRLWPTMALCSIIIFLTVRILDPLNLFKAFEVGYRNFLPSLTFTSPMFWNTQFMDSSFWSIEIEVKFYILSALVYYLSGKHFGAIWTSFTLLVLGMNAILNLSYLEYFLFPKFLPFFSAGILFYIIFKKQNFLWVWAALILMVFFCMLTRESTVDKLLISIFYLLFLVFIFKEQWLSWANHQIILAVGLASYPFYLLHQHIGVILINHLSYLLPLNGNWTIAYPIMIYLLLFLFSYIIYITFEGPVHRKLRVYFASKQIKSDIPDKNGLQPVIDSDRT